jgi:hypothetical protein
MDQEVIVKISQNFLVAEDAQSYTSPLLSSELKEAAI